MKKLHLSITIALSIFCLLQIWTEQGTREFLKQTLDKNDRLYCRAINAEWILKDAVVDAKVMLKNPHAYERR